MSNVKSWTEIMEYISSIGKYEGKIYPLDYIFDENKSVKWNREEVVIRNEKVREGINNRIAEAIEMIVKKSVNEVMPSLNPDFVEEYCRTVLNKHIYDIYANPDVVNSYGINEILSFISNANYVTDILDILKENK